MPYHIIFPLDIVDTNKYNIYDIGVIPEGIGVVNAHWWHAPILGKSPSLEEGTKLARKVMTAFEKNKPCPCEQTLCRLKIGVPNYYVEMAPKPARKTRGK